MALEKLGSGLSLLHFRVYLISPAAMKNKTLRQIKKYIRELQKEGHLAVDTTAEVIIDESKDQDGESNKSYKDDNVIDDDERSLFSFTQNDETTGVAHITSGGSATTNKPSTEKESNTNASSILGVGRTKYLRSIQHSTCATTPKAMTTTAETSTKKSCGANAAANAKKSVKRTTMTISKTLSGGKRKKPSCNSNDSCKKKKIGRAHV